MASNLECPGGKGLVFRHIINQQPPHEGYVEAFAGGLAVGRNKRLAKYNYGIDIDTNALDALVESDELPEGFQLVHVDALRWLRNSQRRMTRKWLIYLDPPYLMDVRSSQRDYYTHEFSTPEEHIELISLARLLPTLVQLSGYRCDLYDELLHDWRRIDYQTTNRAGNVVTESLWMNYPEPQRLHDYSWLGDNYREREDIKRQQQRWRRKLAQMPRLRRLAMMSVIEETFRLEDTAEVAGARCPA